MDARMTFPTIAEAEKAACQRARQLCVDQGRCTILTATYDHMVRLKHLLAEDEINLGITVAPLSSWILDRWELYGDGRQLVCPVDRLLLVRQALRQLREAGAVGLVDTPGTVRLLSDVAKSALPHAVRRTTRTAPPSGIDDVCAVLRVYEALLRQEKLVEESSAILQLVSEGSVESAPVIVLDCETTAIQDELIGRAHGWYALVDAEMEQSAPDGTDAELSQLCARLYHPDFEHPVKPSGQVRFAFPAGAYAFERLILGQIAEALSRADADEPVMALAARHPDEMFDHLAPGLAKRGISTSVTSSVVFPETDFGRTWMELLHFVGAGAWDQVGLGHINSAFASDYALSPFGFMSVRSAQGLDVRMRAWRGQTVEDAFTDLESYQYDDYRDFAQALEEGDVMRALTLQYEAVAKRRSWPEAYRMQQLSAIEKAHGVHQRAAELGLTMEDALRVLEFIVVPVKAELVAPDGRGCVHIVDLRTLGRAAHDSYDAVCLADLSAEEYPLKDDVRSVDQVMMELGVYKPQNAIAQLRRSFAQALAAARGEVLLSRSLNDAATEESRPTALLEELIDCYRRDPQNADEVDKLCGLPADLMPYCVTLGEEDLCANLDALDGPQPDQPAEGGASESAQELSLHAQDYLTPVSRSRIILPKLIGGEGGVMRAYLSPSAIESYLECPYKWFAQRRVRAESPDAVFDVRAFGNFAHKVLEDLHNQMRSLGHARVDEANLPTAIEVLHERFDQLIQEEQTRIANDALVPLSEGDRLDIKRLLRQLEDFVSWEAQLLPDFAPYGSEVAFGEENPFEYAGLQLVGRVDRIDVDAYNRAVVIDYKNSVGPAYNFYAKDAEGWQLPRKVQAAIYAQMVARRLGLTPVGSVYLSYTSPGKIAGLYDSLVLNPAIDLPGINADLCGCAHFADELDRCEEAIALHVAKLREGCISPHPIDEKACEYCPVTSCVERRS